MRKQGYVQDTFDKSVKFEKSKEKKRKDYAFWRQLNEKPSIVPGCPNI